MKYIVLLGLLLFSSTISAQYKTLTLKSGSAYRYTKLHFVSDDTLFFKSKTDKLDYKVATADLSTNFFVPYGKYYQYAVGLMLGGAGAAFLLDTDFVALYAIVFASPGGMLYAVTKTIHDNKKIHQRAILAQ
jgi:hypothetical protein